MSVKRAVAWAFRLAFSAGIVAFVAPFIAAMPADALPGWQRCVPWLGLAAAAVLPLVAEHSSKRG